MLEEFASLLFEFLMESLLQVLLELGFRGVVSLFSGRPAGRAALGLIAYALCGLAPGGLSLLVVPRSFIARPGLRLLNLIVTPVLAGLVMAAVGSLQKKKGKAPLRIDSFGHGFAFALGMAAVRFAFATR